MTRQYQVAIRAAATTARGEVPGGGLIAIEEALRSSPRFRVVFENRDAAVFQLAIFDGSVIRFFSP